MSTSPLSIRRFQVIFGICWLVLMADHAMALHWFGLPWIVAMFDSLISNGILFLFCLLIMNTLRYYLPRREQVINIFIWCIFFTAIWLILIKWLLRISLGYYNGYSAMLHNSLSIRFSISFLLLGCVTMISVLWQTWNEQKENQERKSDAEKLAKEAELFKLRQQLQPHFLFNSLNSINALIGTRPEEARKMVQQLSDFLRGTIRKEENQFISFAEELENLKLYLEIEKVRFGYRLKTELDIGENTLKWKMPALLMQPLMENAIKFGLYGTTGEVVISLRAVIADNHLVVAIVNPFDPDMQRTEGTGFGLKSVRRRLYLLFGRNDLMEINKTSNAYVVVFRIPDMNE
ncbi:MAG TPA: histidine kinase [Chitinophagaceae bacterium]|nr:histidine kinase [Chitinophagaceae bacterium]